MCKFENIGLKIGKLVDLKNKQYGNSINNTEDILKILYPTGITIEQYNDVAVIVRVLDKIFRITRGNQGEENAWNDIAGYGVLMSAKNNDKGDL